MIVNNINHKNKEKKLLKFKPRFDNTMAVLLIILMFIIGVSIGSYEFQLKLAHAVTSSDISISYPASTLPIVSLDQITLYGNYKSVDPSSQVIITLDGKNMTTHYSGGAWYSDALSVSTGYHSLSVELYDSNGILRKNTQFQTITGHVTPTRYGLIAIEYSEACQQALTKKGEQSCPQLKDLIQYDTSNRKLSGDFITKKDGTVIRSEPRSPNHYIFYTNMTNTKVCVLCKIPLANVGMFQIVWVEPTGFSYTKHTFTGTTVTNYQSNSTGDPIPYTSQVNEQNAGLVVYYDRYVDDACETVNMDYSKSLMQDTIGYLKSGCTITGFNKTSITKIPTHPLVLNSPYSSIQYDKYLKGIFNGMSQLHNEKIAIGGGLGPSNLINHDSKIVNPQNKFTGVWAVK